MTPAASKLRKTSSALLSLVTLITLSLAWLQGITFYVENYLNLSLIEPKPEQVTGKNWLVFLTCLLASSF